MKMNAKVYDVLKFVVWLWVPLATFITTLLQTWYPNAVWLDQLTDTFIAIEVFLGAIVSKSNYDYNKEMRGESENDDASDD